MSATGRLLVAVGIACLGAAAWLFLRDEPRPVPPGANSVPELLEHAQERVRGPVEVTGRVIELELLEEDVAGTTIIGDKEHPLLVIARDAQELPPIEDGAVLSVQGELQILEVAAQDGLLAPGPIMERFRDEPYVVADQVEPSHP